MGRHHQVLALTTFPRASSPVLLPPGGGAHRERAAWLRTAGCTQSRPSHNGPAGSLSAGVPPLLGHLHWVDPEPDTERPWAPSRSCTGLVCFSPGGVRRPPGEPLPAGATFRSPYRIGLIRGSWLDVDRHVVVARPGLVAPSG